MDACRICSNAQTKKFLRLGPTPLANSFLTPEQLEKTEQQFPLDVAFCKECGLVQLDQAVPREVMFREYIYVSSTSQTMPTHFVAYADEIVSRFINSPQELVVEVGSNDGCLLRALHKHRVRAVGVEPASNLAAGANAAGLDTVNDFFGERCAREIQQRRGTAKVIIGNNVLAHIADLHDLVAGLDVLLGSESVAIFEVPYLVDLLAKDEFDTIYHEHLSYFALRPLCRLFGTRGMRVFDVNRLPVHGGSMRVYVSRIGTGPDVLPSVGALLRLEEIERLDSLDTYEAFAGRVARMKQELVAMLRKLKASGARIAGYGAPAKGNTLLNHFQIGTDLLDFVVDRSPLKQGKYTPGRHLPVMAVGRLLAEQPDYVLLLAWNFAEEIFEQQREYLNRGGKFVVPIPQVKIIDRNGTVNLQL